MLSFIRAFTEYREYRQCMDCKKIYTVPPYICKKCGARLLEDRNLLFTNGTYRTDKCEVVVAKKTLFGWKVREEKEKVGVEENDD